MINVYVPIRTVSEMNNFDHWTKKHKRHKSQKATVKLFLLPQILAKTDSILPCILTITRISPRYLDRDNLYASLKYVTDACCELLVPGLAIGRADSDKRIQIEISQEKGGVKEQGVRIQIRSQL